MSGGIAAGKKYIVAENSGRSASGSPLASRSKVHRPLLNSDTREGAHLLHGLWAWSRTGVHNAVRYSMKQYWANALLYFTTLSDYYILACGLSYPRSYSFYFFFPSRDASHADSAYPLR